MEANGRGTGEHFNCHDEIDIYFETFAKAFVGIGSVIARNKDILSYISFNLKTDLSSKSIAYGNDRNALKNIAILNWLKKYWLI